MTIYTPNSGSDWTDLPSTLSGGDIVDGQWATWSALLDLLVGFTGTAGNPVIFRRLKIDGAVNTLATAVKTALSPGYVRFEDVEFFGTTDDVVIFDAPTSATQGNFEMERFKVYNSGSDGIVSKCQNVRLLNGEVYNIDEDGIAQRTSDAGGLFLDGVHVHDVDNDSVAKVGDCVQVGDGSGSVQILNSRLEKDTGNKQALAVNIDGTFYMYNTEVIGSGAADLGVNLARVAQLCKIDNCLFRGFTDRAIRSVNSGTDGCHNGMHIVNSVFTDLQDTGQVAQGVSIDDGNVGHLIEGNLFMNVDKPIRLGQSNTGSRAHIQRNRFLTTASGNHVQGSASNYATFHKNEYYSEADWILEGVTYNTWAGWEDGPGGVSEIKRY